MQISDEAVKALAGVREIHLGGCTQLCTQLSDEAIKALAGVLGRSNQGSCGSASYHSSRGTIHLTVGCTQLSDEAIKALAGVREITLHGCTQLSDEAIKPLIGVERVAVRSFMEQPTRISDAELDALPGLRRITIGGGFDVSVEMESILTLAGVDICE
eukprot:TRINITY_DN399_c0_g1_i15.p1 TRINITY_DN399_c0_g1~~TRINITY_DN399_c0_g1_i15.p1  ORF type:complete len:158 (-),score=19.47 TRINITY_DN399_c0_g1_i15:269-742(-)